MDSVARLSTVAVGSPFFATAHRIEGTARFRRDYLEILAVVGGAADLILYPDGRRSAVRRLEPGRLHLFRPTDVMRLRCEPGGVATVYVSFAAADWITFAGLVGVDPTWAASAEPPAGAFDPDDSTVPAIFDTAIRAFQRGGTQLDLVRFWLDIVPHLFPGHGRRRLGDWAPTWLIASFDLMHEEENLRRGIARWAEVAHVSPWHLAAATRRCFGTTPTDVVTELRLRHAATLLASSRASVREVATRCGFGTASYFSTTFRRAFGVPPREYRTRATLGAMATI